MIYHSLDNTQIKHSLLATRIGVADGRRPTVFSVAYTCSSVKALTIDKVCDDLTCSLVPGTHIFSAQKRLPSMHESGLVSCRPL